MEEELLRKLLAHLEAAGVAAMDVWASGSGDSGDIGTPEFLSLEGCTMNLPGQLSGEIESVIDELYDTHGFDYYNDDGGSSHLSVNVLARKCEWNDYAMRSICESSSEYVL